MDTKYVVLMETELPNKYEMKWGRCKTLEDVEDFKNIYLIHYPTATFEVYEVKNKI